MNKIILMIVMLVVLASFVNANDNITTINFDVESDWQQESASATDFIGGNVSLQYSLSGYREINLGSNNVWRSSGSNPHQFVDGYESSYWFATIPTARMEVWTSPFILGKYSFTCAGYTDFRTPEDWIFEAYDGSSWHTIHSKLNQRFSAPYSTKEYTISNVEEYSRFKWTISDVYTPRAPTNAVEVSELKIYERIKVYPTSQSYYIYSDGSQIDTSGWNIISSIKTSEVILSSTDIKYLVSFDGRTTWKYWDGNSWEVSNLNDVQVNGMDDITLEGLTQSEWSSIGGFNPGTLDFAIDLESTVNSRTPTLNQIIINYSSGNNNPIYLDFMSFSETTNFSEGDVTNVTSLTLAIDNKGKIAFPSDHNVNAEGADYDTNVKIEDALIYVNSAALDSSFNDSATLTFEGVDCNYPYVYYSATASTRAAILTENTLCPSSICSNIQCTGSTLTVDVTQFSGYAVNGSANLTIDADDPKYVGELVTFTAEYRNATGLIEGATCTISLPGGDHAMNELASHIYNYSTTFASAQTVDYNVTCSKAGENTVFANDTAIINAVDIPEFSTITLGLGLIAVLAGLFIIRKRK
ncbi:MAG: hypothetical protein U9R34_03890 [Nanoarchaeota archaeon]|nr:hypothetical protein [Nanoarchaeota archaeon]